MEKLKNLKVFSKKLNEVIDIFSNNDLKPAYVNSISWDGWNNNSVDSWVNNGWNNTSWF